MSELIELLQKAKVEALRTGPVWVLNQLTLMINRVGVEGSTTTTEPTALAAKKGQNVGSYPTNSDGKIPDLHDPRQEKKSSKAVVVNALKEKTRGGMDEKLRSMSNQELIKHFQSVKAIRAFIINRGGKLHSKASIEDAVVVLKDLLGAPQEETEDEINSEVV